MSVVSLKARVRALEARGGDNLHIVIIPRGTSNEDYEALVDAGHAELNAKGGGLLMILNQDGNGMRGKGRELRRGA